MKIIRIAQEKSEILKKILTTIYDNMDGRRYVDPDIMKQSVEKEIQEAVGTAYLQVSYSHWHGDIIVEKYFENEYANQEYGKTYRIPIDYNDPEKTIKQTQRAITILS